ncbi:MAG: hypothetical protein KDI37_17305, partial [Xanthomonadales bacterium]|nr:hypothetical protein [Xanthomonadales bacterium]
RAAFFMSVNRYLIFGASLESHAFTFEVIPVCSAPVAGEPEIMLISGKGSLALSRPADSFSITLPESVFFSGSTELSLWDQNLFANVVVPGLLSTQSRLVLRGCCVVYQGLGVLVLAGTAAGKSRFCAEVLSRGGALVSDDVAVLTYREGVVSAYGGPRFLKRAIAPDSFLLHSSGMQRLGALRPSSEKGVYAVCEEKYRCATPIDLILVAGSRDFFSLKVPKLDGVEVLRRHRLAGLIASTRVSELHAVSAMIALAGAARWACVNLQHAASNLDEIIDRSCVSGD